MVNSLAPKLVAKQTLSWLIGIILFFIGKQINIRQIARFKYIILFLSCFLLLIPILQKNITRGSRRWIHLGTTNIQIQPSEIIKPWLMIILANTQQYLYIILPALIILLQPDLGGTFSTLSIIIPFMLYDKRLGKILILLLIVSLLCSPLIWKFVLHDYQKDRITFFLNPNKDPKGRGYNLIQSKIAIGSGGIFGKGYKKGTQGQLLFLPEKHTDFIFAAIAEEIGLLAITILIATYYILIHTLINKAFSSKENSCFLFTLSLASQIWLQTFINIGMNLGILPVTGIPLPFVSVGGSSIISLLFSLGLVFSS